MHFVSESTSLYFTTPTFTSSPRVPTEPIAAEKPATKTEKAATTAEASSKSKKSFSSSKSTKSFNDFAAKIQGTYVGKGKLTLNSNTVESYTDIVIKIKRIDKTSVEVSVIESNGSEFFSEPAEYDIIHDIKNGANNSFKLINKEISSATITIDANKKCTYIHPRVNIDGDIYQLSITATLQQ